MNILFVDKRFPNIGGVAVVTSMLAKQFLADGHKVYVATLMPKLYDIIEDKPPQGIAVFELNTPTWNLKNIKKLKNIIIQNDIDIMINQWALRPEIGFICNQARKGTKCKLICELHGAPDTIKMIIEQTEKIKKSKNVFSKSFHKLKLCIYHVITRFSIRYVYRITNYYVLLSKRFIPKLKQYAKMNDISKVRAIGNAISIPVNGFKYDFENKKKQLLYIGRMDPYNKRVNRIVEAWEHVYNKYPDWTLELVGEGPQLPDLKQYVQDKSIQRVTFHGFQKEQPIKFYEDASILLLTSDLEGFGLVIIEAMQFGVVPVVYGSYDAVYDIIDHGINGYITSVPYDRNETIKYICRIMDDDIQRRTMAISAIDKSKKFTLSNIKNEWYSIMN